MTLDYFYGAQADQFAFYRIPKALFTDERFKSISAEAKILYGILLDRMSLSRKNGWLDEQGRVFIIFTLEEVMEAIGCADQKATKLLNELDSKAGLIERKRQGLGKPNLIFVKNFVDNSAGSIPPAPESRIKTRENHDSADVNFTTPESRKSRGSNTDSNYTDLSQTETYRPSFERMIESLKNGEANVVICKDFSRFFRDYVEIGDYLERIFPFLGVRFIAVNDGYDSDDYKGSTAGMEVVMKYIVYSYYSRDLSQKIKTVMSTRKSKGEFVASQAPYGYMKDPDVKRKIIPNPDTAPVVRKIFDLALEGKTPAEIAVVLNDYKLETPSAYFMRMNPGSKKFRTSSQEACWTSNNVREILKRREYTGVMVMNQRRWKGLDNPRTVWTDESEWQIIPDCHEAIISESEYEEAQKVFRKIRKGYDRSPNQYLLRSLVHCGACGRAMQRQKHSPVIYYTCLKSVSNRETACPVGERFVEADLERIVKNDLLEKLRLLVDVRKFEKMVNIIWLLMCVK